MSERELEELQALLDRLPAPLEPLDVCMLDGYLCGVLLQPRRIPVSRWWPHVTDIDGRLVSPGVDLTRLKTLVLRRHAELDDAIERRQWFDPWVFEMDEPDGEARAGGAEDDLEDALALGDPAPTEAVFPWVAGFAAAVELFPDLMSCDAKALTGPLALLYRHLAAEDLEDADELLEEIESLEPPADLTEAVEGLVRATLLLADLSRRRGV
ncbi:MAG: YecA family protein [Pseudomonadota bacterium]|nr:YecA family protein [Pseudomonadota bacterium]